MSKQLVFIHGRSQQGKDPVALKAEWIGAFKEGLKKNNLQMPIAETDVRFPFYGDTLDQLVEGGLPGQVPGVVVRGAAVAAGQIEDENAKKFVAAILEQVKAKAGITDEHMTALAGEQIMADRAIIVERGILNWEWVQTILKAIDRYVPQGSATSIALATYDVYQYLTNKAIREEIDTGVMKAITAGVQAVVVSHSLGTVVAYNILRQKGGELGWKVPLFVTLGCPLGVSEIREVVKRLSPPTQCPTCATQWFNAMDDADVVALYPLTQNEFPLNPLNPCIINKTNVRNNTSNHHGITGYLNDAEVAKMIYDALVAP